MNTNLVMDMDMNIENTNNFPSLSMENLKNTIDNEVDNKNVVINKVVKPIKKRACEKILEGLHCIYGFRCTFAHSIAELVIDDCMHGKRCYSVFFDRNGVYCNNGDRICRRLHPSESLELYHKRVETKKNMPTLPDEVAKVSAKCTKMCRVVLQNTKCEILECQYAHSLEELIVSDCGYGDTCIHVKRDGDEYKNIDPKNKVCMRIHPDETIENVVKRRAEEIEKPSYSLFPKGVSIKVDYGKTSIKTPQNYVINVLKTALDNGIKDLSITTY